MALEKRLYSGETRLQFFTESEYRFLVQVCERLIPQPEYQVDIVQAIDRRLSSGQTNGWRYDAMPNDGDAFRQGVKGIDETAQALFTAAFDQLSPDQQDRVLGQIQTATAPGSVWKDLPADRFFEELLAEAVEIYYSHPLAQEAIGYVGMADQPDWQRIGLNEREEREPLPLNSSAS